MTIFLLLYWCIVNAIFRRFKSFAYFFIFFNLKRSAKWKYADTSDFSWKITDYLIALYILCETSLNIINTVIKTYKICYLKNITLHFLLFYSFMKDHVLLNDTIVHRTFHISNVINAKFREYLCRNRLQQIIQINFQKQLANKQTISITTCQLQIVSLSLFLSLLKC